MFTGIIEELGTVKSVSRMGNFLRLEVAAKTVLDGLKIGDSVAVNGVCLTATAIKKDSVTFDAMPETATASNIGRLTAGAKVNLERALKVGDRISGHIVSGHVDCEGIIRSRRIMEGNTAFEIAFPEKHSAHLVEKGSIAVDGISLTVMRRRHNLATIFVIPHTLEHTTLKNRRPSDRVNLEFDQLLKRA